VNVWGKYLIEHGKQAATFSVLKTIVNSMDLILIRIIADANLSK